MNIILAALNEYGIHDFPGNSSNPRVLEYFSDIGASYVLDDDTAWCAAFMNWILKVTGHAYSAALNARSFLDYGVDSPEPLMGDICILWRGSKGGTLGHVGILIKKTDTMVYLLGGNQSNSVNITSFPISQVLGFRVAVTPAP